MGSGSTLVACVTVHHGAIVKRSTSRSISATARSPGPGSRNLKRESNRHGSTQVPVSFSHQGRARYPAAGRAGACPGGATGRKNPLPAAAGRAARTFVLLSWIWPCTLPSCTGSCRIESLPQTSGTHPDPMVAATEVYIPLIVRVGCLNRQVRSSKQQIRTAPGGTPAR
jgi:hypothetical protein